MALTNEMVLTKDGVKTLTTAILKNVNKRIKERIVTEINETSDENHSPAAKTVFESIKNFTTIKHLVIADGDIMKATITPAENILYMVRKTDDAKETLPYAWIKDKGFIFVGAKSTGGNPIVPGGNELTALEEGDINNIVDEAANNTDPGI